MRCRSSQHGTGLEERESEPWRPGPDGITISDFPAWFRERWDDLRQQLLDGTYRPHPVRRKVIAKPDGGQRLLGIPNVLDRLIQQAIVQVLTPIFDPTFSDSSHGFRPKRSAHGATKQVRVTIRRGYRFAADVDLSKFFDRVQHDVLMARVARRVHDKPLLQLIGRYLRAGVMVEGVLQPTDLGTPQGGPIAPPTQCKLQGFPFWKRFRKERPRWSERSGIAIKQRIRRSRQNLLRRLASRKPCRLTAVAWALEHPRCSTKYVLINFNTRTCCTAWKSETPFAPVHRR